jgi:hypothetical protein
VRSRGSDNADDPKVWTTPQELVKAAKALDDANVDADDDDDGLVDDADDERTYQTPLPPLAVRILKPLLKPAAGPDTLVFKGLLIRHDQGGSALLQQLDVLRPEILPRTQNPGRTNLPPNPAGAVMTHS